MSDRESELRDLAETIRGYDVVSDAWIAKSFTDRIFVVDLEPDADLPREIVELLEERDLRGYNEVHDIGGDDRSFVGSVADVDRHQFVDARARDEQRSHIVG